MKGRPQSDYRVSLSPDHRWTHWVRLPRGQVVRLVVDQKGFIRDASAPDARIFRGRPFNFYLHLHQRTYGDALSWMYM